MYMQLETLQNITSKNVFLKKRNDFFFEMSVHKPIVTLISNRIFISTFIIIDKIL